MGAKAKRRPTPQRAVKAQLWSISHNFRSIPIAKIRFRGISEDRP